LANHHRHQEPTHPD
jgi:hypothetical protein